MIKKTVKEELKNREKCVSSPPPTPEDTKAIMLIKLSSIPLIRSNIDKENSQSPMPVRL